MIDICITGAQLSLERMKALARTPLGIFLHTAFTANVGIIILMVFFAMVVSPTALKILLPGIIGFNSAMAGFNIINKGGILFPWKKFCLIAMAAILGVTGCLAFFVLYPWEPVFDKGRCLASGGSALALMFLGAWLATTSTHLNKTNASTTEEERLPEKFNCNDVEAI